MFSIGFSEVIVVVIIALLLNEPRKLSSLFRDFKGVIDKIRSIRSEVIRSFKDEDDAPSATVRTTYYVEGEDGKLYEAYDVGCIKKTELKSKDDSKNTDC